MQRSSGSRILYKHNWKRKWGHCKCCGKIGHTGNTAFACKCHEKPHAPCLELRGTAPIVDTDPKEKQ